MKIAITGGTGFIGQALVARLSAGGHSILVLSRQPGSARLPPGVRADFFDAAQPPEPDLLDEIEAVIHLAGESIAKRWTAEQKRRVLESRQKGTSAIARAAVQAKTVRTIVSGSAIGYYGPHGDEELREDSPPGSDFLASVCRSWEQATAPAQEAGIRVVHLRTGIVLHPDGGALQQMLGPFKLGLGGRIGSGRQYMSWIHRGDLEALFVYALSAGSMKGAVNGTAPNPVTNEQFTRTLGRVLNRPALIPAPAFALRLALGEMSSMLLTGQRVAPAVALASGFKFAFPDLEPALRDLLDRKAKAVSPGSVATGAANRQ